MAKNQESSVILSHPSSETSGLGTFGGVFTPSILTILGVIMYLRFGWVVGHVGLWQTLLIVTISTSITFLTGLSISAIATDQVVKAGGAYYMISRSLGIETGGAVGIPLYLAQAFSVALYTIGFAESLVELFPTFNVTLVAFITTIILTALALKSTEFAIKTQYFIMAAIALSLVSLCFGHPVSATTEIPPQTPGSVGFWAVLAVFFPAVTGIMAGVNMSGDLKDPQRSIPIGTMAAVMVGYLIYMVIPILLSQCSDPATLIAEPLVMRRMAFWGDAIFLGVWGATLSSALGSIMGAPRVLQALARDGILPQKLRWLGRGDGAGDEPRLGMLFTLGVALAGVSIGDLNLLAPILTMFFLTTYMVLNVAAGIEGFLQSPSFRPTFKVHWSLSLLGAVGCICIMFLINAIATLMAGIIVLGIYLWLERRELAGAWGDVRNGLWMTLVRTGLSRIETAPDAKNWRPHLLVFSGSPTKRLHLIELAIAFTHNRALITVASVLPSGSRRGAQQESLEGTIREYLEKQNIQAFVRVVTADDPFAGMEKLVESYGIGALIPNTILVGDTEADENRDRFCQMIAACHDAKRNVVIFRNNPDQAIPQRYLTELRRIDIWWGGLHSNGGLMLIFGYLLRTSSQWRNAEVFVNLVVADDNAKDSAETNLNQVVKSLRIGATPRVIVANGRSFDQILETSSHTADLVFLGLPTPDENFSNYYRALQQRTPRLPAIAFVLASEELAFAEVLQKD